MSALPLVVFPLLFPEGRHHVTLQYRVELLHRVPRSCSFFCSWRKGRVGPSSHSMLSTLPSWSCNVTLQWMRFCFFVPIVECCTRSLAAPSIPWLSPLISIQITPDIVLRVLHEQNHHCHVRRSREQLRVHDARNTDVWRGSIVGSLLPGKGKASHKASRTGRSTLHRVSDPDGVVSIYWQELYKVV